MDRETLVQEIYEAGAEKGPSLPWQCVDPYRREEYVRIADFVLAHFDAKPDPVTELTAMLQAEFSRPSLQSGRDRSRWLLEHAAEIAELAKRMPKP